MIKKRKNEIRFKLTDKQMRKLKPLLERALREANQGEPGIIAGQPVPTKGRHTLTCRIVRFGFIPNGAAVQMLKAAKTWNKSDLGKAYRREHKEKRNEK